LDLPAAYPGLLAPTLATAIGVGSALCGFGIASAERRTKFVVPFSAGVLLGVVLFGLAPELIGQTGWVTTAGLFASGYSLMIFFNRYGYAVCPTCAHDHDHDSCASELRGLAAPLLFAAALHSVLDGWSVAVSQLAAPLGLRVAVPLAIALHKAPEGIALGGILRAAFRSQTAALGWSVMAEGATFVGGLAGILIAPRTGVSWALYPLGVAAGWLLYLGNHAVHAEWKRRGAAPAFLSALSGVLGAAAIQRGAEALFR
jgi:zinc transporter ZupT